MYLFFICGSNSIICGSSTLSKWIIVVMYGSEVGVCIAEILVSVYIGMKDPVLAKVCGGQNFNLKKEQGMRQYCCMAFGGPHNYHGTKLSNCHAPNRMRGMRAIHFERVMGIVQDIMRELKISKTEFHESMATLWSSKYNVLGLGEIVLNYFR